MNYVDNDPYEDNFFFLIKGFHKFKIKVYKEAIRTRLHQKRAREEASKIDSKNHSYEDNIMMLYNEITTNIIIIIIIMPPSHYNCKHIIFF